MTTTIMSGITLSSGMSHRNVESTMTQCLVLCSKNFGRASKTPCSWNILQDTAKNSINMEFLKFFRNSYCRERIIASRWIPLESLQDTARDTVRTGHVVVVVGGCSQAGKLPLRVLFGQVMFWW